MQSRIVESNLSAEVVRLQKLHLDEALRRSIEEVERLLSEGRFCEAEALLQNADARMQRSEATRERLTVTAIKHIAPSCEQ